MAARRRTQLIHANPQILLSSGGLPVVLFDAGIGRAQPVVRADAADGDAGPVPKKSPTPEGEAFMALGYRQTVLPAAKGGKANANGFRFRNGSMRALARSFRGRPFLTGHAWGDVRARGGTITDAYLEELQASGELALLYDITAISDWAKQGLANGTIDRFSIGASRGQGEITCSVHGVPVWSTEECFCWPGQAVMNEDGDEVIAEWEYEDPIGEELSAVNVPAVDGTFIVDATSGEEEIARFVAARTASARQLAALCGRHHPRIDKMTEGGWLAGGFPAARASRTMTRMEREELARMLGLPATATWEEIRAKQQQVVASAAQLDIARTQLEQSARELEAVRERERAAAAAADSTHVEAEITRLRGARGIDDQVVAKLRATFAAGGRSAFDDAVQWIDSFARPLQAPTAGAGRPPLQSDAPPARTDATAAASPNPEEPDAWQQHATNPELPKLMRACKLTPEDVKKHGPKAIAVVHNLGDLITATAQRGG